MQDRPIKGQFMTSNADVLSCPIWCLRSDFLVEID